MEKFGNPEITFTSDEFREIQDALQAQITRMCKVGQTAQEIEYHSLANAWSSRKKVIEFLMPVPLPNWVEESSIEVMEAIANPKVLPEPEEA